MKKRQIFIELTPLLDVILIMIFVLLVQSRAQVEASADTAQEASQAVERLERELEDTQKNLDRAERRARSLGTVGERSALLTLSVEGTELRRILVTDEAGAEVYVSLDPAREDRAGERLAGVLRERIGASEAEAVFLVFQYDRNAIYRTEYELIDRVLRELKPELDRDGVYLNIAELDIQEEKGHG